MPENPLYLTALEEATSFGAALCGKALQDNVSVTSLKDYAFQVAKCNIGLTEGVFNFCP